MSDIEGERLFPASQRRRQRAREAGRVVRSRELTSAVMLLASAGFSGWCGAASMRSAALWLRGEFISLRISQGTGDQLVEHVSSTAVAGLSLCLGLFAVAFTTSLAIGLLQTGFVWSTVSIIPTPSRLLPSSGWGRLLDSLHPGAIGLSLLKLGVPTLIVAWLWMTRWDQWGDFLTASPPELFHQTQELANSTGWKLGLGTLALGIVHYAYRWWRMEVELRMTEEEVREEQKQS